MKKIQFIKTTSGICIYLNDFLFKDDNDRIEKLTKILNIFTFNNLLLKSDCFVDEGDTFLEEMQTLLNCELKTEFTKTRLFSKRKYSKVQIAFNGEKIEKAIEFIVKNEISLGFECYNTNNVLSLQFVVNDNDGACITFNFKLYNPEEIKAKVKEILV